MTETDRLAKRTRRFRDDAGLTQKELAERMGVDHTEISHIEAGRRDNLTLRKLRRLAEALEVSVGDLVDWNHVKGGA